MPQSEHWAIPWVLEICDQIKPHSLLDIGIGMGEYGFLVRQKLDIGGGKLQPQDWNMEIDGVEVFAAYDNPIWSYYYNSVYLGDCRTFLQQSQQMWDMILLNDVIEHFTKPAAIELLSAVRARGQHVLITTPYGDYAQGPEYGNEAETHLSTWYPADFERLGAATCRVHRTFVALFSTDPNVLERVSKLPALTFPDSPRGAFARLRQLRTLFKNG